MVFSNQVNVQRQSHSPQHQIGNGHIDDEKQTFLSKPLVSDKKNDGE